MLLVLFSFTSYISIGERVKALQQEIGAAWRAHTLSKAEKRRNSNTGTMKLMSAHDEKTLNTAVALANELTSKSMNDLDGETRPLPSPCERSKFNFKFPLGSHHNEADKDAANKAERRNFSEEAKSVPDIQATITEESKKAYASLIEEPTHSSSLVVQMKNRAQTMTKTIYKVGVVTPVEPSATEQFNSLPKQLRHQTSNRDGTADLDTEMSENLNVIPLPPRGSKPKLVDKPRHIRKYPLRLPEPEFSQIVQPQTEKNTIIYQNTVNCKITTIKINDIVPESTSNDGIDVFDGPEVKVGTNPFTVAPDVDVPGPSSSNPFKCFLENASADDEEGAVGGVREFGDEMKLNKDHVSVEDLLEFADKKPSSQQRGVESDEVRIMNKVLKQQVTPEECLESLEFCNWNIHMAIKLLRIKISIGSDMKVSFDECQRELEMADGDVVKAASVLVLCNKNNKT